MFGLGLLSLQLALISLFLTFLPSLIAYLLTHLFFVLLEALPCAQKRTVDRGLSVVVLNLEHLFLLNWVTGELWASV